MKILVTGCAGFIGINFTNYLLLTYPEDKVVGVDALTYAANTDALRQLCVKGKFTFYHANICDVGKIEEIFNKEKPDIVVNLAAESHVDRSIVNAAPFVETNIMGTQVLLDACVRHSVKRFHQASTDEVYGDLPLDSSESFTEESYLKPSSPYSASKASADLLALSYHKTHSLSVSISRSSNNYGKYQHSEKLIPKAIENAIQNKPISIYGSGENVRDWLYVEDNCRAIDLIMREGRAGEIYNVGGGNLYSNISLVKEILSLLHKPLALIDFVPDRKGHDRKYALSSIKLERELSWKPCMPFSLGLSKTVEWYKNRTK